MARVDSAGTADVRYAATQWRVQAVVLVFAFTSIYFTGVILPRANPNELSRIEATVAIVDEGTLSIDGAIARLGDHEDKASGDGRFYSNKAPGLTLAWVPLYAALRLLFPPPDSGTAWMFVILRLATVTALSLYALVRLGQRLAEMRAGADTAALVVFAVSFGTPFLFYARSLFSHAWAASLLFLAWDALRRGESADNERARDTWSFVCGLLAGCAAISEFPTVPVAVALAIRAAAGRRRAVLFVGLGALGPLMILAAYNAACFGSPFTLPSAREAAPQYAALVRRGLFGIELPTPRRVALLLFDPARGILLFSPFLLWGIPGIVRWWRSGAQRADCLFVLAATAVLFLPISGYGRWDGGFSLGIRYLVPIMLIAALAFPHALASAWSRGLFVAAVAFSVANHVLLSSTMPHVPPHIPWPATTLGRWMLASGWVAPNLGRAAGLGPIASLAVPLAMIAAVAALCVAPLGRIRPPATLAAGLGLLVFLATLVPTPALDPTFEEWRAKLTQYLVSLPRD
jgi:hypothetical protein